MVKSDKQLVTKKDLKEFGDKFEKKIDTKMQAMEMRISINVDNKISELHSALGEDMFKWKSEIFNLVDGLGKVIRDNDEYKEITSHQITENTRRIEVLENNYTFAKQ